MDDARNNPLIAQGAEIIAASFRDYVERFRDVTRHARAHFESANWHGVQHDAALRFDLYADAVSDGLIRLRTLLDGRIVERPTWTALRESYAAAVSGRGDVELAESFFNSFTRKIFHTIGIDPSVEFISSGMAVRPAALSGSATRQFARSGSLNDLIREILEAYRFSPGWENAEGDARKVAAAMEAELQGRRLESVELARPVFYRGKGAYLVGASRPAEGAFRCSWRSPIPQARSSSTRCCSTSRRGRASCSASRAPTSSWRWSGRARWSTTCARIMPRKPSPSCTTPSASTSTARPSCTAPAAAPGHHRRPVRRSRPGQRGMVMACSRCRGSTSCSR